jgi:AcrR family transcriptional regulator
MATIQRLRIAQTSRHFALSATGPRRQAKCPGDTFANLTASRYHSGMPRLKAPHRRKQLIEVATKVFAKWGYNAATTAAIAEAAGVTEPILYRHFASKQELFVAITRAMSEQTLRHWHDLIQDEANATDKIRTIAREFPNHIRRLEDAYHVIHGALVTSRDGKVLNVLREHYTQIERFFSTIIVAGQNAGEFRRDLDPKIPAWHLINVGIGYAMIALNLQQLEHVSVERMIEFILRGLET